MQSQVESFFPTLHPKDFPLGVIILDMLWKTGKYILYSYWFLIFTWHSSGILLPSASVCVWALSQGLTLASMFINDKMVPSGLLQVYNTKLKSTVNKLLKPKALGFLLQFDQRSTGQSQSWFMSLDIMRSVKS